MSLSRRWLANRDVARLKRFVFTMSEWITYPDVLIARHMEPGHLQSFEGIHEDIPVSEPEELIISCIYIYIYDIIMILWYMFKSVTVNVYTSALCVQVASHDDVIKWKHFPRYWPFVRGIHRSPVNPPLKGQWRGALMFSLIWTRINGWVNNGDAIVPIMTSL